MLAIVCALLVGVASGALYGVIFNRLGVPSFVISLAGLLAFLGVQLALLGSQGAINLPFDSALVKFAQLDFVPQAVALRARAAHRRRRCSRPASSTRRPGAKAQLSGASNQLLLARSVAVLVIGLVAVFYLYRAAAAASAGCSCSSWCS